MKLKHIKLKGGALYVAIIISILISIVLSLFIVLAQYNIRSLQDQAYTSQLHFTLNSGFEFAKSSFYSPGLNKWQKMPGCNDSVRVNKQLWGAFYMLDIQAKNKHQQLRQTGLYGARLSTDTALMLTEQNRPIGLAGKIIFKGACYLPVAGIKSAYIEGTGFSDLNSLRPFIRKAPDALPAINEQYLKDLEATQTELNPLQDSLLTMMPALLKHSFKQKTAVVQQSFIRLENQELSGNIKCIANDVIIADAASRFDNILLIARKVIFKKGFTGRVHVIARDSIVTEDDCHFNYPSSFTVYNSKTQTTTNPLVCGIFFGEGCSFSGSLLACENPKNQVRMMIRVNRKFQLIGTMYSSTYADVQGSIYGSAFCRTLLLQTPSAVYENHLLNCRIDPKTYGGNMCVADWFGNKQKQLLCAQHLY